MPKVLRKPDAPLNYHLVIALIAAAILLILVFWPHHVAGQQSLARCLTDKGVTMYGADTCEACQNQKKILGEDFKNIKYVNCEFFYNECRKMNIATYPVWTFGERKLLGTQTRSALAAFAGCSSTN